MNKHYEQAYKKISKYKLSKMEKALIYKQLSDVLEEVDDEIIDDHYLNEIINDIFELNEIEKVKRKVNYRFDSIFFGLLLIASAILLIMQPFTTSQTVLLYSVAFTVYFLIKRFFFLSCVAIYFMLASTVLEGSFTLVLAILFAYLGLKILFFRGGNHMEYFNIDKQFNSKFKHSSYDPHSKYTDKDVLFIDNKFNGTNIKFVNEEISYINLNNKFGGSDLDFSDFEFKNGDLVINVNNKYGGLSIKVNENTNVSFLVSNRFGGIDTRHKEKFKAATNTIYVQGDNKFGGIDAIYK